MRVGAAFGWAILGGLVVVACGSSTSDGSSVATECSAGESAACSGAGGCSGQQVCAQDGTYGACECGGGDSGSPSDSGAARDSGSKLDSGNDSAAVWTPKKLSGLLLWTDGENFGDAGTTITDWPDQSGARHDLLVFSSPPSVVAHAVNGLPAAGFVAMGFGTDYLAATSPDLGVGSDNFIVELVMSTSSCATGCALAAFRDTSVFDADIDSTTRLASLAINSSGQLSGRFSTSPLDSPADTVQAALTSGAHIVALRRTGASSAEIRIDGSPTAFALTSPHSLSGTPIFIIGAHALDEEEIESDPDLTGNVAEVVVAHNPSDADVTQLESYLKSKYGL